MKGFRNIKRITLSEFSLLSENKKAKYDVLISSIKSIQVIKIKRDKIWQTIYPKSKDIWELTYSDIIELKDTINNLSESKISETDFINEVIRIVYRLPEKDILNIDCLAYFNCTGWVTDQLIQMMEVESAQLKYEPNEKLKAAGVDKLDILGHYPTIKALMKSNNQTKEEVLSTPYNQVFMDLCHDNIISEINKKLVENVGK